MLNPDKERAELADRIDRGYEMLTMIKDLGHRATILSLVEYLERKLAEMDRQPAP